MKSTKQRKTILTRSQSDLLASCLVIISAFVLMFCWMAVIAKAYFWLFFTLAVYGSIVWGTSLLLTGRSRSEEFLRFMTIIGVLGAGASVLLIWAVFAFRV